MTRRRPRGGRPLAWIDIDNPPQVQFLYRFRQAFLDLGVDVIVTARNYGITLELLRQQGADFHAVGSGFGRRRWQKLYGLARRSAALGHFLKDYPRPAILVCAGRVSALTARFLEIPAFILDDYEHMDLSLYGFTRANVVFPDVIDARSFTQQGIPPDRHVPYRGLKEDITFAGLDVFSIEPLPLPARDELVKVLVRPPAAESHYYREESGRLTDELLAHLAGLEEVVVVFVPRYDWQVSYVDRLPWKNKPVLLERGVPFLPLLKACDVVVSSGGTMVREAAYLGLPAYSTFRGDPGGVDLHLESIGRLDFISSPEDFDRMRIEKARGLNVLESNPNLLYELAARLLDRSVVPLLDSAADTKLSS